MIGDPMNPDPGVFGRGISPWESPGRLNAGPRVDPPGIVRPKVSFPGKAGATHVTASHWYANIIEGFVAVAQNSGKFLDVPVTVRNMLFLRNASAAANIFIGFGNQASTASSILRLTPNTIILFDTVVPQNDLYAIADAAAGFLAFGYSTTSND